MSDTVHALENKNDELWLENKSKNTGNHILTDLPASVVCFSVIDQHFVSLNKKAVDKYNAEQNKENPNVMRDRMFVTEDDEIKYANKYTFGTAPFCINNFGKFRNNH